MDQETLDAISADTTYIETVSEPFHTDQDEWAVEIIKGDPELLEELGW